MNFRLGKEQEQRRARAAAFSEKEVRPLWQKYETDENLIRIVAAKAREQGVLDDWSSDNVRKGCDLTTLALMIEEMSWGEPALGLLQGNRRLCRRAIQLFGDAEFEKRTADGGLWSSTGFDPVWLSAFPLYNSQDDGGERSVAIDLSQDFLKASDSFSLADDQTRNFLGCAVTWRRDREPKFMICLLRSSDHPVGVTINQRSLFALNAARFSRLRIERRIEEKDCVIPFGTAEEFHRFRRRLLAERAIIFGAIILGATRSAFEYALEYSKSRISFGKPIGRHQAIALKLADMGTYIETMRLTLLEACSNSESPDFEAKALSAGKWGAEIAIEIVTEAVQIFGGHGYLRAQPVEKLLRDVQFLRVLQGHHSTF
jgi:acyl-CoA dehydrogenase